jgi:hypothetical protein
MPVRIENPGREVANPAVKIWDIWDMFRTFIGHVADHSMDIIGACVARFARLVYDSKGALNERKGRPRFAAVTVTLLWHLL